jgi:hypothetical protein
MINISRPMDVLLFNLSSPLVIDDISVQKGLNQLRKEKNVYALYRLDDLYNPYVFLSTSQLPQLFHVIFANLINSFYLEENENITTKNISQSNIVHLPQRKLKKA